MERLQTATAPSRLEYQQAILDARNRKPRDHSNDRKVPGRKRRTSGRVGKERLAPGTESPYVNRALRLPTADQASLRIFQLTIPLSARPVRQESSKKPTPKADISNSLTESPAKSTRSTRRESVSLAHAGAAWSSELYRFCRPAAARARRDNRCLVGGRQAVLKSCGVPRERTLQNCRENGKTEELTPVIRSRRSNRRLCVFHGLPTYNLGCLDSAGHSRRCDWEITPHDLIGGHE